MRVQLRGARADAVTLKWNRGPGFAYETSVTVRSTTNQKFGAKRGKWARDEARERLKGNSWQNWFGSVKGT